MSLRKYERREFIIKHVKVSSITAALHGKEVLNSYGIEAEIRKSMSRDGKTGCGYEIVVFDNENQAFYLLETAGIGIAGPYL